MQVFFQHKGKLFFDYFVVFISIVYLANVTTFVRSTDTWENIFGLLLPIIVIALYAVSNYTVFSKRFLYIIGGYFVYFILTTIQFRELHPRFFEIYFVSFLTGYVIYSTLKYRFFKIYGDLIFALSVFSLFFWSIQQVDPNAFNSLIKNFSFSKPGSPNVLYNIIIYTVSDVTLFDQYVIDFGSFTLLRNAGFAWEPGAFACFINLAIYWNLIQNRFVLIRNFRLWIMILALLTTFSTTGYAIFIVIVLFYLYNLRAKFVIAIAPAVVLVVLYISTLPFMLDKLQMVSEYNTDELIENSIMYGTSHTPQRFQSFLIDMVDFKNNPILGYGGHNAARWTEKLGAQIATISGIGNLMAQFGIVGLLFFVISLIKTAQDTRNFFEYKGWFFLVIIMVMLSISYGILFNPIIMCFWMFNRKYLTNKEQMAVQLLKPLPISNK